jgi:hypothetical protein
MAHFAPSRRVRTYLACVPENDSLVLGQAMDSLIAFWRVICLQTVTVGMARMVRRRPSFHPDFADPLAAY